MKELQDLGLQTSDDLEKVLTFGTYRCFWNRIFLVGQFGVGKSTLAKVLVGDKVPEFQEPTDGISIYMGRAGMDIENRTWKTFEKGKANTDPIAGMLISLNCSTANAIDEIEQLQTETEETDTDTDIVLNAIDQTHKAKTTIEQLHIQTEQVITDTEIDNAKTTIEQPLTQTCELDKDTGLEIDIGMKAGANVKPTSFQAISKEKQTTESSTVEQVHKLIKDAIRERKYQQRIVPFDVWDFGGQKEFYMTHQLFITNRGVFVLMFNGSKDLRVDMASIHNPFHKNTSKAVYLLYWVNCILTFCPKMKNGFPRIILVATHKDKVPPRKIESQRQKLKKALEELFKSHSGKDHLEIHPLIFINGNDPADPEIEVLRNRLIERAFEHPRWGEEMPTAWVPLELMIAEKVEEGINVISKEEMKALNERNEVLVMSDPQLETFLRVQHSLAKIIYFEDASLRNYIIINPVFLVDVLRSLITDQQFWPKDKRLSQILVKLSSTGTIFRNDIISLWQQEQFQSCLKHSDYLIDLLVHLDILVSPQSFQSDIPLTTRKEPDREPFFIVPCMIKKADDTSYLKKKCTSGTSIVMSYVFKGEAIPPSLVFRFLASFISMYDIQSFKGQQMLFCDLVVVEVDENHDVAVQIKSKQVVVYLVHSSDVNENEPTLASAIQECLTAFIFRISKFYQGLSKGKDGDDNKTESPMTFEIHFGGICVRWFRRTICFFPHNRMPSAGNETWRCDHGTGHSVRQLSMWFAEKVSTENCREDCRGLGQLEIEQCPLDRHLRRLAASMSPSDCHSLVIELGLQEHTWNNLDYQFQGQNTDDLKFKALHCWKQENPSASFLQLKEALLECNLSDHYLCKVFRDIKLPEEYSDEELAAPPTPNLLHHVASHIGDSSMQLAIELGLNASEIDEIRCNDNRALIKQTRKILLKWQNERHRAINKNLFKALFRIGKASCLKGIKINCTFITHF